MILEELLMEQRDMAHCKDVFCVSCVKLEYVAPTAVDITELSFTSSLVFTPVYRIDRRPPLNTQGATCILYVIYFFFLGL